MTGGTDVMRKKIIAVMTAVIAYCMQQPAECQSRSKGRYTADCRVECSGI